MAGIKRSANPAAGARGFAEVLNRITDATGVHAVVLDSQGALLCEPELCAQCAVCARGGKAACHRAQRQAYAASLASDGPTVGLCPDAGTHIVALPIVVEGARVATWVLCQFVYEEAGGPRPPAQGGAGLPAMNREALTFLQMMITALVQPIIRLQRTNQEYMEKGREVGRLAYADYLLGLPNRNQLQKDLAHSKTGCLLLLDLPGLARMNEAYGWGTGNELLRVLRDHLLGLQTPGSRLYRLTAVDFGLWVRQATREDMLPLAQRLVRFCAQPLRLPARQAEVLFRAAVGILPLEDLENTDINSMASAITYIMQQAERTGELAVYDPYESHTYRRHLALEAELADALDHGMRGFHVVFQPVMDTANSLWSGVEALCRWTSTEYGPIPPAEFVSIAEALGEVGRLGLWVLNEAVAQIAALGLQKAGQFVLNVNLSPLQLAEAGLAERVLAVLQRHGYPAERLRLEITESSELALAERQLTALQALRQRGVRFALDDFGVGYASLSRLYKLPVDVIKTDRSLVQGVENSAFLQRLFYVMGELAHVNGMKLVAEGVETQQQARALLLEGVDYFQGFLFSMPLTPQELGAAKNRFFSSGSETSALRYTLADLGQGKEPGEGYALPPALYRLLSRCLHILYSEPQMDKAVNRVLELVGQSLGLDRAYVYLRDKNQEYRLSHSWCAEGAIPFEQDVLRLCTEQLSPDWMQDLLREEMYIAADVAAMPPAMREIMERHGVRALAEFPLVQDGVTLGAVSFNDCKKPRYWAREDIRMLRLLANMLAAVLTRLDLLNQLEGQRADLQNILDKIDAFVYVVVPETGEILFANRRTRQVFGLRENETRRCWQVLQGCAGRCSFCPNAQIQKNNGGVQQFELYNKLLGEYLQVTASGIRWQRVQEAVLFSAFDINALKTRQLRLEETAAKDALTGVHNRQSFADIALPLLHSAHLGQKPVTLAFVDVDGLKRENDLRGHKAGDELLCAVVESIRKRTRGADLMGRYGGDEFLVLYFGCVPADAEKSLNSALGELAGEAAGPGGPRSFSYGLVGTGEKPFKPGPGYLADMIASADERMLAYKTEKRGGGRKAYSV